MKPEDGMTIEHGTPGKTAALIGAGAVGLSIAAALLKAGWNVVICGARSPFAEITITEEGQTASYPVRHVATPEETEPCEVAILAVKSHQTRDVAEWLKAFNRPGAVILVAQNGVEHQKRIAEYAPDALIIPSVVYLNAERPLPGQVVLRRVTDCDLCLPDYKQAQGLVTALRAGGMRVRTASDMTTVMWTKLLTNITANPLTALTGRRAEVLRDPLMTEMVRQIMTEAVAVGQAEGAALTKAHIEAAVAWLHNVPEGSTTSMRQDRLAGRALEYDALTGAVVRAAERHGISTPLNRLLLALLTNIQPDA